MGRSLTSVAGLTRADVMAILSSAAAYAAAPNGSDLAGRVILNLFFENSTRTIASFEMAIHRQGGRVITLPLTQSSMEKGESLRDTARTLNAMGPDCMVVRHAVDGTPDKFTQWCDCPIINAGDGTSQHPTQALLDLFTLWNKWGDVAGRRIVICGDIKHSRVARSSSQLLQLMGANIILCGPASLLPNDWNTPTHTDFDQALAGADAIMMLRVQKERIADLEAIDFGHYIDQYCLTESRLASASPDAILMHPGPLNRGVEIMPAVADGRQSVILQQVAAGVAIRQAILRFVMT